MKERTAKPTDKRESAHWNPEWFWKEKINQQCQCKLKLLYRLEREQQRGNWCDTGDSSITTALAYDDYNLTN